MAYGARFKSDSDTFLISDEVASLVFMGKATHAGGFENPWWDNKCFQLDGLTLDFLTGASCPVGNAVETMLITNSDSSTQLYDINTSTVLKEYQIESVNYPLIYTRVDTPNTYGASVVTIEKTTSTGLSYGYPVWNIKVMLSFKGAGTRAGAVSDTTFYCFSEMDPSYSSSSYGLKLANSAGDITYHSDWKPLRLRGLIVFNPGSANYHDDTTKTEYKSVSTKAFETSNMGIIYTQYGYDPTALQPLALLEINRVVSIDYAAGEANFNFHLFRTTSHTSDAYEAFSGVTATFIDYTDYD